MVACHLAPDETAQAGAEVGRARRGLAVAS
jgi:hypothetical protein